jgi:biopolymer transport protein ExbD
MRRLVPSDKPATSLDASLSIVNIVLLLILFFLATGQLLNPPDQGVNLSETTELPIDRLPTPVLVINPDGSISLNGDPVAPEFLELALTRLGQPPTLHVMINRAEDASVLLRLIERPELAASEIKLVTLHLRLDE